MSSISALKKSIRALEKTASDMDSFIGREYLDPEGTAVIHVTIGGVGDVVSPYSFGRQLGLHPNFVGFLDQKIYPIPLKYPIKINFVGNLSQEEKARVREMLKEHYSLVLTDRRADLRFLWYKFIGLVALGLLGLAAFFTVQVGDGDIFSEVLSIIGSFALWEAADTMLLERRELKEHYLAAGQAATAQVDFTEEIGKSH